MDDVRFAAADGGSSGAGDDDGGGGGVNPSGECGRPRDAAGSCGDDGGGREASEEEDVTSRKSLSAVWGCKTRGEDSPARKLAESRLLAKSRRSSKPRSRLGRVTLVLKTFSKAAFLRSQLRSRGGSLIATCGVKTIPDYENLGP